MTGYVRDGRNHTVEESGYRLYSFVILHTIPLRILLKKLRAKAGKYLSRPERSKGSGD